MSNWTPSIEIQSSKGPREIQLFTELLKTRKVFLTGIIDEKMAESIIAQLLYLDEDKEPIHLIINSPGGSVSDGLMIYDTLQGLKSPVDMYCVGEAASMAAVLFASGKKGYRHIFPHAETMIHEPLVSSGAGGSASALKRRSDELLKTKRITSKILAKHTGRTKNEINKAISYDHYMSAKKSIKFGMCDDIVNRIR